MKIRSYKYWAIHIYLRRNPQKQLFRTFIYRRTGDVKPYQLFGDFYYNNRFAPLLMFVVEDKRVSYLN